MKGYDSHLIVKALKSEFGNVRVISQNLEKYLSLLVGQLKFLDSFQFAPKSLDDLSKTLEDGEFRYLVESCTILISYGVKVFTHVIIWIGFDRFDETVLPSQEEFYIKVEWEPMCRY